jgi:hypothetical protein
MSVRKISLDNFTVIALGEGRRAAPRAISPHGAPVGLQGIKIEVGEKVKTRRARLGVQVIKGTV